MKKRQIVVLGASQAICTKKAYEIAEEVGEELAKKNCITITGGGLGVMEASLKGAKNFGGLTVGIIPWENIRKVNDYADVVIATGIGWSRDAINLNSCDGAIVVGGGAGTLNEVTYAYIMNKPIIAVKSSGGTAEEIADKFLDIRRIEKVRSAKNAKEAVDTILKLIEQREKTGIALSEFDQDLTKAEDKQDWYVIHKKRQKELAKAVNGKVKKNKK